MKNSIQPTQGMQIDLDAIHSFNISPRLTGSLHSAGSVCVNSKPCNNIMAFDLSDMSPELEDYDQQVFDDDYELAPPEIPQPDEVNDHPGQPSQAERLVVSTLANIVSTFADFLTVAIHTILYDRQVYSPDLFISTRAYNHPVRQARHPVLCRWIQDAVEACLVQLTEGRVSKISLVILSPNDEPLERFVWDVSSFPLVPTAEQHTPFQSHDDPTALSGTTLADIEEQLRASLGKISLASARLSKLPQECTFTIAIELKEEAPAPVEHTSPWVPSQRRPISRKTGEKAPSVSTSGSKTTPIRTVEAGALFMEMWIEESKFKEKAVSSSKP